MFPHMITVFHYENESYQKGTIDGVFLYGNDGIKISGKGIEETNSINIIIPKKSLNSVQIKEKDYIVKGLADDITSVKDLNKYENIITVFSVNDYDCGSDLDCLLVSGK